MACNLKQFNLKKNALKKCQANIGKVSKLCFIIKKWRLNLAILPLFLVLAACQSPIDQAQQEHKNTLDKWHALMQYGESDLPKYGISITAQLLQLPNSTASSPLGYQFSNIKLNDQSHFNTINLLSPWFDNKYICNPVCSQLTEYKSNTNQGNSTLLNYYFEQYQYQFYDFYVQVYQINSQLEELAKIQPLLLKDYLLYLVDQQAVQSTLSAFVKQLNQALSPKAYQTYLLQPKLRIGAYQPSTEGLPALADYNAKGELTADEQTLWQQTETRNAETLAWQETASNSNEEVLVWQGAANSDKYDAEYIQEKNEKAVVIPSFEQWNNIRNNNLKVGDLACSYQGNMFGKVIAITQIAQADSINGNRHNRVTISLFGQAKQTSDGVVKNQLSGYLFNTSQEAISFKPIKGVMHFLAKNVSKCLFQ